MSGYSPINYAEQIYIAVDHIRALRQLKKDVDPASCMSVSVRRGVPQDNANVDDDEERRPWLTMSFSGSKLGLTDGMHTLIDMLIADRVASLKGWVRSSTEYSEALRKADETARILLKDIE